MIILFLSLLNHPFWLTLGIVINIISSILTFNLVFGYFQGKFVIIAKEKRKADLYLATYGAFVTLIFTGPILTIMTYFCFAERGKFGLMWPWNKCKEYNIEEWVTNVEVPDDQDDSDKWKI
jgi:hypothetical protein